MTTSSPPTAKGPSYTMLAAAIVVAAVIISATLLVALGTPGTVTKTVPEVTTSGDIADCLTSQQVNVPWFGTLVTSTSSPAVLCVQLYEFNASAPMILNMTSLVTIQGSQPVQGGGRESVSGAANFTVVASQRQVLLGGPTNAGEGTVVAFAITARPGASGTYTVGIEGYELGSEPDSCGGNGYLIAGNGKPDYGLSGGCITYSTTSAQGSFTIPGVTYNILSSTVYFRMLSVTNSTQ